MLKKKKTNPKTIQQTKKWKRELDHLISESIKKVCSLHISTGADNDWAQLKWVYQWSSVVAEIVKTKQKNKQTLKTNWLASMDINTCFNGW